MWLDRGSVLNQLYLIAKLCFRIVSDRLHDSLFELLGEKIAFSARGWAAKTRKNVGAGASSPSAGQIENFWLKKTATEAI